MKIKNKLVLQAIFLAIVPALVLAVIITLQANHSSFKALERKTKDQLVSLREVKKTQIISYLDNINSQVITLSKNLSVVDAADDFIQTFHQNSANSDKLAKSKENVLGYYRNAFNQNFMS